LCSWRDLPRSSYAAAAEIADRHAVDAHGDMHGANAALLRRRRAA
jgi:hypothetical protein